MSADIPIVDRVEVGNAHTNDVVYIWFTEDFIEANYEDFADGFVRMSRAEALGLCGDVAAGLSRGRPDPHGRWPASEPRSAQ